eukprot:5029142-Pyramimonas_sp.AAC.1
MDVAFVTDVVVLVSGDALAVYVARVADDVALVTWDTRAGLNGPDLRGPVHGRGLGLHDGLRRHRWRPLPPWGPIGNFELRKGAPRAQIGPSRERQGGDTLHDPKHRAG